jgi:hypothetical protein
VLSSSGSHPFIPFAIVINVAIRQIVPALELPVYLDFHRRCAEWLRRGDKSDLTS